MPAELESAAKAYPHYSRYCKCYVAVTKHSQNSSNLVVTVMERNRAKVNTKEKVDDMNNRLLHSHQRSLKLPVKTRVSKLIYF
jgi:hypothetical protein